MDMQLLIADPDLVHRTAGPTVTFALADSGRVAVRIMLSIGVDKTLLFPDPQVPSGVHPLVLPPGIYQCALGITATMVPGFAARSYRSTVSINGVPIARCAGTIPKPGQIDHDTKTFALLVN